MGVIEGYQRRLEVFGGQRKVTEKSDAMREILINAMLHTHLCFGTYLAFTETSKAIFEEARRNLDEEDERFQSLVQSVDTAHDRILDTELATQNLATVTVVRRANQTGKTLGTAYVIMLTETVITLFKLADRSLERIYKSNELNLASDALEEYVKAISAMAPFSLIQSLIDGVKKIHSQTRITQIYEDAVKLLEFLEDYIDSTQTWAIVTQHTIDSLIAAARGNGEAVSLEESYDNVEERLSEIVQRLQEQTEDQ